MQAIMDPEIIVSELDFARLTQLIDGSAQPDTQALDGELGRAVLVRPSEIPTNVVTMNSEVVYEDLETGVRRTVHLVYPRDADATCGKISVLAPIGSALLGLRVGQSSVWRVPAGWRRLCVVEIRYQPEAAGNFHL